MKKEELDHQDVIAQEELGGFNAITWIAQNCCLPGGSF
jgi:hypothetical protein